MMPVNVRYENKESNADRIVGLLKDIDMDSVDLQFYLIDSNEKFVFVPLW
jgi:hypothetical protein